MPVFRRLGLEWIAWAVVALMVWLLTLASVSRADLSIASPAAAVCATVAVAVHHVLGLRLRPSRRYFAWIRVLPAAITQDTVRVLSLPWRQAFHHHEEGHWQRVPVAPGTGERASTSRAAATMFVSFTPGSFVVHDDSDTGELLTHILVSSPASMTDVVRR